MINPETTIPDISPYCKRLAKKLASLELKTVRDLLFYYPSRYEDLSAIKKINELSIGDIATIKAKVEQIQNYRSPQKHKKITEAIISDGTGKLKVVWFNQWYLTNTIKQGDEFYFIAKLSNGYTRELINYYKKHLSQLPAIDRERLKTNPLRILDSKEEKTKEINENAPDSVSFLCPSCKKHFKEVLEYL